MKLSLESESNKRPWLWLTILIIIVSGLLWRQKDFLIEKIIAPPQTNSSLISETTPPPQTEAAPPAKIALVYSAVVNPNSEAFTADLYLEDAEHPLTATWETAGNRRTIETYIVQPGDTLWDIAARFELSLDTIRWSNPDLERNPDLLTTESELIILPVNGVYHTVETGDTLDKIAQRYGVAVVDITNYPPNNLLPPYNISVNDKLIIPNGKKEINLPQPDPDPEFPLAWPLVGTLTQTYHDGHKGIDIGSVYGAPVYAADDGTVVYAKWAKTGYGYTVIIAHNNNRNTLYSHLKGALVQNGQQVNRGDPIGAVGSTGNSTGPHVHFEVRENQERLNPLNYLSP